MKKLLTIAILAGLLASASAQDTLTKADRDIPHELTREEKNEALRIAYRLNGGVMNGPMVDLTDPKTLELYSRMIATDAAPPPGQPLLTLPEPKPVRTTAIVPDPAPAAKRADICKRHGMRKVVTGRSWRCRR